MEDLKGKKLLILGGIRLSENVIVSCRKLGIRTAVTDYLPDSPAKALADERYMVSTADVDAVVRLAREIKADGIFCSYIDSQMIWAAKAAKVLGVPYYATEEQVAVTTDKRFFRDFCVKNGVPVTREYPYRPDSDDYLRFNYPVIVKPVDSSGGKGISVCYRPEEFPAARTFALSLSRRKEIVVEQYLTGDEVCINYAVQDGVPYMTAMCDRYTCRDIPGVAQVPTAYIYPSRYLDQWMEQGDESVRRMMRAMGLRDGPVFFQSFVGKQGFSLYEMAYRFAGAQEYKIIRAACGYDLMDMMVRHALTGKMTGWDLSQAANPRFPCFSCKLTPLVRPGKIARIEGLEAVDALPEVTDRLDVHAEGDVLDKPGTLDQALTRIFLKADSLNALADTIDRAYSLIRVLDENGEDMLYGNFNTDCIRR